MSPPLGAVRSATESGTSAISIGPESTATIWSPLARRYFGETWSAIWCAAAKPSEAVGFQLDQFAGAVEPDGLTSTPTSSAIVARPTPISAPIRKPKRERYGATPFSAGAASAMTGGGSGCRISGSATGLKRLGLAPGSTFGEDPGSPVGRPAGEGGGI